MFCAIEPTPLNILHYPTLYVKDQLSRFHKDFIPLVNSFTTFTLTLYS